MYSKNNEEQMEISMFYVLRLGYVLTEKEGIFN